MINCHSLLDVLIFCYWIKKLSPCKHPLYLGFDQLDRCLHLFFYLFSKDLSNICHQLVWEWWENYGLYMCILISTGHILIVNLLLQWPTWSWNSFLRRHTYINVQALHTNTNFIARRGKANEMSGLLVCFWDCSSEKICLVHLKHYPMSCAFVL